MGPSLLLVLYEVGGFAQSQAPSMIYRLTMCPQATESNNHGPELPKRQGIYALYQAIISGMCYSNRSANREVELGEPFSQCWAPSTSS